MIAAAWLVAAAFTAAGPSTDAPTVFSPGVISSAAHDAAPAFSPDGEVVYFSRSSAAISLILVSRREAQGWSTPEIAPFSGRWQDMEPTLSPDGKTLVFVSNRPIEAGGAPLDGKINGVPKPGMGAHLWRVRWQDGHWGEPEHLPDSVNANPSTYAPSIAANGNLYFMRPDEKTSRFRLFMARAKGAGFDEAQPLPFSDGSTTDVDPAILPDESALVFGSGRHAGKDIDLFIAFRTEAGWSTPTYLGEVINGPTSDAEPRWGADRHTIYFSSERVSPVTLPLDPARATKVLGEMTAWNNGLYNIWTVDLQSWLTQGAASAP